MKNSIAILLMACAVPAICAQGTDKVIDLPAQTLTIAELIDEVQKQSTFYFSFSNRLPLSKKISFQARRVTVAQILLRVRQEAGIRSQVRENKVVLSLPPDKHTVSGYLRDAVSGENLIGGSIYTLPDMQGTTTNNFGYFSLTLPADSVHLVMSYTGYENSEVKFVLKRDTILNVHQVSRMLQEVTVTATDRDKTPLLTQMSSFDIPVGDLKILPALGGEFDVMKSLQLLPGVQAGNEGTSGLYVRGGGPDQNLILLDGVPVYNASHLFGFFSVFNADAINHVELIKGGFPARYGGRLSSVIDISMKEGNKEKIKGEGSAGIIASRFTIEGPLKKDRASFIISGRRTYADLVARPIIKRNSGDKVGYFFYDLNTKLNYIVSDRSRLYLSAYSGKDKGFHYSDDKFVTPDRSETRLFNDAADLGWGNVTAALRWNYVLANNLFSNITATYSRYNFRVLLKDQTRYFNRAGEEDTVRYEYLRSVYSSGIEDYGFKWDLDFTPLPDHYIRFGAYGTQHLFRPGASVVKRETETFDFNAGRVDATEFGAYAEDDFVITPKLKMNTGLHVSGFYVQDRTFLSLQPRVSVRYLINENFSVKSSYVHMTQFIHLLTNAGVGLPTDLWVPATQAIRPQRSVQIAGGVSYTPNPTYEITLEGYHKSMNGVIEYRDGASYLNTRRDWQNKVVVGSGESYGGEFFLHKKTGKWKGWVGYTLSRTWRQFDELNFGERFPYRYDRRHDVELTVNRDLSKRTHFSAAWVYATGQAISLPTAIYAAKDDFYYDNVAYYSSRNGFRMSAMHRLDLSITFRKTKRWGERWWAISIYNAYSRQNPFYVDMRYDHKLNRRRLYQYGLLPIVPSFSYNFKF